MSLTHKTINTFTLKDLNKLIDWILKFIFLIILILVFVPFSPKMPAPGLDASWALGLNQAVAQGLSFGKEIIFTLGPYASIYTKMYHPSTDWMMIGGSIYLALSYWLSIILLMKDIKWRWVIAFGGVIFGMIYARDSLFFSYPLLTSLYCFKNYQNELQNSSHSPYNYFLLMLLFAPFGLLALVKGSLLILGVVTTVLCALFFIVQKRKRLALVCMLSPLCSMVLFWIIAGQSIVHLPLYFIISIQLASGFSEAMALEGNNAEIIIYLLACSLILFTIAWQKNLSLIVKLFYLSIFIIFLFLSFKAGFTRHLGHSFITGTSILIAALLLPFIVTSQGIMSVIIFSIGTTTYINGHYTKISLLNNFVSIYSSSWYGFKQRIQDKNWVKTNYQVTLSYLQNQTALPPIEGSTDIYSYDQNYLFAAQIHWSPRPIFQSYSVFTQAMAEKNKQFLLSKKSPDNIIFKIQPIDDRIPSQEDGTSWSALLSNYHPVQLFNDFLILKRNNTHPIESLELLNTHYYHLGEVIAVPNTNQPLFVEIDIKPTFWGLLATTFFKPESLKATIELDNGITKQFRIVSSMAKSAFLLSPLIEETAEFELLYTPNNELERKRVKSITIASTKPHTTQWKNDFLIRFKTLSNRNID